MSRERRKGTSFESMCVRWLSDAFGYEVDRSPLRGSKDRGDILGATFRGRKVVLECKNCKRMELAGWMGELETEMGNADADFGAVIHKRKGCGESRFGDTYVTMPLKVYAAMLAGGPELLGVENGAETRETE